MAALPVERKGPLSDHGLLQRYLQTPQTAGDAFYQVKMLGRGESAGRGGGEGGREGGGKEGWDRV